MTRLGIVLVTHVAEVSDGLVKLLREVAKEVDITVGAGLDDGEIGTSFERIQTAFDANPADELLVFYDLGSAKMNLEMVMEFSERPVHLYDTAFVESAYTAAALIQAGSTLDAINQQLAPLKIK
ncbi:dihydroxyacetone kinase phosphoryl donor subunit DhaM [Pseudolactococcus reticulitermitis]|uniref:phosphoenolpyruvate--glycerone phosphotransferase n=1 Tax=Pseudolactococcus reticulitermitis TaxID=2025039 RepID=A0A224XCY9_9LACT|nr:dihydroxyacetone kinase phosphoryl donor subunit DhaM [Lactococcus reticulitermitis]GAX47483.1 PTS-dependent dihydroxyacetone kinase subunit DhaM [Lactococcus reticulitermitis]